MESFRDMGIPGMLKLQKIKEEQMMIRRAHSKNINRYNLNPPPPPKEQKKGKKEAKKEPPAKEEL